MKVATSKKMTAAGQIYEGKGFLCAALLGMDETNDVSWSLHDGLDNTGNELIPTNKYDASVLGLNGAVLPYMVEFWDGLYLDMTIDGGGDAELVAHYIEDAKKGVG